MTPNKIVNRDVALKSGNQCAFPDCDKPIYDEEDQFYIGELAHIKADSPGGPRYDPNQSDEERQGEANLMFMCRIHHKKIDTKVSKYPVEKLIQMKKNHEDSIKTKLSEKLVDKIVAGAQEYLRENEDELDLSSSEEFIKWLKDDLEFSKDKVQEELTNISHCLESIGEFKEDIQSFIYNLLVHGDSSGSSLNVATERLKNIDDERIYAIVKFLTEERIIDDIKDYSVMEKVQDLENDINYQIATGLWALKGQYSSLYSLVDFLGVKDKRENAKKDLKKILFKRDISPLQ